MPEYAFDVKLAAVVRIQCPTEKEARARLKQIDCCSHMDPEANPRVTEYSMDDCSPHLFEVDGETVE
jgi:hypothetical protein